MLHGNALFRRQDSRTSADYNPGLFPVPYSRRLFYRVVEKTDRSDPRGKRVVELQYSSRLCHPAQSPRRLPAVARVSLRAANNEERMDGSSARSEPLVETKGRDEACESSQRVGDCRTGQGKSPNCLGRPKGTASAVLVSGGDG